jgi:hypothetical protein
MFRFAYKIICNMMPLKFMQWIAPSATNTATEALDKHLWEAAGKFGFAAHLSTNAPFNANAMDKVRLRDMVGSDGRFPFGLPRTDNAYILWTQPRRSALNPTGRAVNVMVAVGPKWDCYFRLPMLYNKPKYFNQRRFEDTP